MDDVETFMGACRFDDVPVEDELVHINNRVGILGIELMVRIVDRDGAVFAYEHVDGPISEMTTAYELEETDEGAESTARTTFSLAIALVGEVMDGTVVKRQRRRELEAQFDWLEAEIG